MANPPTLYEWAGGSDAFSQMINAFYDRVEQDDLLSPFFPGGVHEDHRRHVAAWWSEVFGGPAQYTEDLGGYERMLSKHLDLRITEEQRYRFTTLMRLAADDAGMPDDPEFRSALVAYLEWGTRIALGTRSTVPWSWSTPRSPSGAGGRHHPSNRSLPATLLSLVNPSLGSGVENSGQNIDESLESRTNWGRLDDPLRSRC